MRCHGNSKSAQTGGCGDWGRWREKKKAGLSRLYESLTAKSRRVGFEPVAESPCSGALHLPPISPPPARLRFLPGRLPLPALVRTDRLENRLTHGVCLDFFSRPRASRTRLARSPAPLAKRAPPPAGPRSSCRAHAVAKIPRKRSHKRRAQSCDAKQSTQQDHARSRAKAQRAKARRCMRKPGATRRGEARRARAPWRRGGGGRVTAAVDLIEGQGAREAETRDDDRARKCVGVLLRLFISRDAFRIALRATK